MSIHASSAGCFSMLQAALLTEAGHPPAAKKNCPKAKALAGPHISLSAKLL